MISVKVLQNECRHDEYLYVHRKKILVILVVICNIFSTLKH
jgi:hypothetical protein